jgi:hypothetical protein
MIHSPRSRARPCRPVQIGRPPVEVNGDDTDGLARHPPARVPRVHASVGVVVHEDRGCPGVNDPFDRRESGHGRHQDLVAGDEPDRLHGELNGSEGELHLAAGLDGFGNGRDDLKGLAPLQAINERFPVLLDCLEDAPVELVMAEPVNVRRIRPVALQDPGVFRRLVLEFPDGHLVHGESPDLAVLARDRDGCLRAEAWGAANSNRASDLISPP